MITGIRGSGKTVTMTAISKELQEHDDFIVVDLNSDKDLLEGLASELYQNSKIGVLFTKKDLSFSFNGIIFSPSYGKVKIVLPRFYNYIKSKEF